MPEIQRQAIISFSNYEKYILPILKERSIPTIVLYKVEGDNIRIKSYLNGFALGTSISKPEAQQLLGNSGIKVGLEPIQRMSGDDFLDKFNAEFMDGRGIPELDNYADAIDKVEVQQYQ